MPYGVSATDATGRGPAPVAVDGVLNRLAVALMAFGFKTVSCANPAIIQPQMTKPTERLLAGFRFGGKEKPEPEASTSKLSGNAQARAARNFMEKSRSAAMPLSSAR